MFLLSIHVHLQVVVTTHSSDDEDDSAPDFDGSGGGDVERDEETVLPLLRAALVISPNPPQSMCV